MSSKLSTLPYLYFGIEPVISSMWENTVRLVRKFVSPLAKSDVLKKATYPNIFSTKEQLLLPMINEEGDITKVCSYSNSGIPIDTVDSAKTYNKNTLMYWTGAENNDTLFIVSTIPQAISIKYCITDNEGVVPDVLFINSFRHKLKNDNIFSKYKHIIAIGSKQLQSILIKYGLSPTIHLETASKDCIDPLYIVIRLLKEIIYAKDLHKSANLRISLKELAEQHVKLFSNINSSYQSKSPRKTLLCLRTPQKRKKRRKHIRRVDN